MLSDKIKYLRKINYLNQAAFAKKIGVTQSAVSQWEHDLTRPNSDQLQSISKAFGISVDELLSDEPDQQDTQTPRTIEAKFISDSVDRMTPSDRERALNVMKAVFSDYFESAEDKIS